MNVEREIKYGSSRDKYIEKKSLGVPYVENGEDGKITEINSALDALPKQYLKETNWLSLKKVPEVAFAMAYNVDALFLKFYVSEPYFKAEYLETHDPVSKDSCVELFISFDDGINYYNLEFNALGTCLAAFGNSRNGRQKLPVKLSEKIKHELVWKVYQPEENRYSWNLTLSIPLAVFYFSDLPNLRGRKASANFYKCGDDLPEPHYLVWNPIASITPDFHQPNFFGSLHFL